MSANWRELEAKGHPEGAEVGLARIDSHLTLCFRSRRPYLGSQLRVLLARPAGQLGGALERCQGVQVGGGRMRGARINCCQLTKLWSFFVFLLKVGWWTCPRRLYVAGQEGCGGS